MQIDKRECVATVNASVPSSSSEDAKRQTVIRLWKTGRYDTVESVAQAVYSGKIADPNLPNRDPLTQDETQAKHQRDRFDSFVRRCERWLDEVGL